MVIHVVRLSVVRSLTLCSSLCSFPCLSYPFFYLNLELNLFLHVVVFGAKDHWQLRQMRSLGPWPKTLFSQLGDASPLAALLSKGGIGRPGMPHCDEH